MNIDNESKVVFMDEYDLDHIFENTETIGDAIGNFETETGNSPEFQTILAYKVEIPQNAVIEYLDGAFDNFTQLALLMLEYSSDKLVIPFLTKDVVDKENDDIQKILNTGFRERRKNVSIDVLKREFNKTYTYHTVSVHDGAIAKIILKDEYKPRSIK